MWRVGRWVVEGAMILVIVNLLLQGGGEKQEHRHIRSVEMDQKSFFKLPLSSRRPESAVSIAIVTTFALSAPLEDPSRQQQLKELLQLAQQSIERKLLYSNHHGYALFFYDTGEADPRRSLNWSKISALRKYLPLFDWVLWLDLDTMSEHPVLHGLRKGLLSLFLRVLVANFEIVIEDIIIKARNLREGEEAELILSCDMNGMNNGAFLIKNTL